MPQNYKSSSKSFFATRQAKIYLVAALIAAVVACLIVFWPNHPPASQINLNQGGAAIANPDVPGTENLEGNPTTGANESKQSENNANVPAPSASVQPANPTGDFVSSHHRNLGAQNTLTSTCITTPGVLCQIRFTYGSTVRELPAQKTNAGGATSWDGWTLQSIKLTAGTWRITAVAANGDKTATTNDATPLVVDP